MANPVNLWVPPVERTAKNLELFAASRRLFASAPLLSGPSRSRDWRGAGFWLRGARSGTALRRDAAANEAEASPANLPRLLALWADATGGDAYDLCTLWAELRAGRVRITDSFYTDDRCYCLVAPVPDAKPLEPVCAKGFRLLERVLSGQSQKSMSIELGVSASTVTSTMKTTLNALGVEGRPSLSPALLIVAACAVVKGARAEARLSRFDWRRQRCMVVSAARPDRHLAPALTEAERTVARLLVEGRSYAQIARIRSTSPRTVANQLAAIFRKLNVSGRNELIGALLK